MEIKEIIEKADIAENLLSQIRKKEACVIMFIDLVGSTEFKDKNPDEFIWLKRLAIFLNEISIIINEKGRVIKYIGDEIMAIFSDNSMAANAVHAVEKILLRFKELPYDFKIKIAIEYGEISFLTFNNSNKEDENHLKVLSIPDDPQGITVDKCARMMQLAKANTILCSDGFYSKYPDRERWKYCGKFKGKGIKVLIPVYQYRTSICASEEIVVNDQKMDIDDCNKRVIELESKLSELKNIHHG